LRKSDENLLIELEEQFGAHLLFMSDSSLHISEFIIQGNDEDTVFYTNVDKNVNQVKLKDA